MAVAMPTPAQVDEIVGRVVNFANEGRLKAGHLHFAVRRIANLGDTCLAFRMAKITELLGFRPDISSLNIIISVCARAGDLNGAEKCYDWILHCNLRPNRKTFCGLIYASQVCMSASSVEKWVKVMHAAQVSAPPGFLRRLLGALHGVTFKVCQKLQFEEQQAVVRFEQAWLLWLLDLGITTDRTSRRLLLSHVAERMWHFMVPVHPTILAEMAGACLDERQVLSQHV